MSTQTVFNMPGYDIVSRDSRQLHDATTANLKRGRYDQVPQLEGSRARLDQPFLSPID